jgi:type II secretory pathway pseudopilin PulG
MKKSSKGATRQEVLIIIIIIILIASFAIPKFVLSPELSEETRLAQETTAEIYSAYKLCQAEALNPKKSCETVNDVINDIAYVEYKPEQGYFTLLNNAKIKFSNKDSLKDGTSFAVILPKKKGSYTLYFTANGQVSSKKPGNKAQGGQTTEATIKNVI